MKMLHVPGLYVAETKKKGRGVFTSHDIKKGSLIEICPLIIVPKKQVKHLDETILASYYFKWGNKLKKAAIMLGYGCLYNHSEKPNARALLDYEATTIEFTALKKIKAGTEITYHYFDGDHSEEIWFDVKK